MSRPFRFGVQLAEATSREDWIRQARLAEELGYSVCVMPDHFGDQLAPFTGLMAVAEAAESIRIGSFVFDNDFRHPLVTAHEAATLDLLTDGRFELGLGAGWLGNDYKRSGIPLDPPGTRVERLEEAVRIIKAFFAGETFSFSGAHYAVNDVQPSPATTQLPHPPLLIGGGGRRILKLAAREADIVSVFLRSRPDGSGFDLTEAAPGAFDKKIAHIRECAGNRFVSIEINVLLQHLDITDNRIAAIRERASEVSIPHDDLAELPFELIGTVQQITDDLLARRHRYCISYITVFGRYMRDFAPIVEELNGK